MDSLDEDQRTEIVTQLAALTAEVVVTKVKNPLLEGKLTVGSCLTAVNAESVATLEYDAAMETLKGATGDRPLTLTFTSPDGLNTVEHVFEEQPPEPLKLRFSHRIKVLHDELAKTQEALLTRPKSQRKELKGAVDAMEAAIAGAHSTFAATQTRRKSEGGSSRADALGLPGEPDMGNAPAGNPDSTEPAESTNADSEEQGEKPEESSGGMFGGLSMPEMPKVPGMSRAEAEKGEEAEESSGGMFGGFSMPSMPEMPKVPGMSRAEGEEGAKEKKGEEAEESSGGMFGGFSMPSMPGMPKVAGMSRAEGEEGAEEKKGEEAEESSGGMFGGFSMPSMPEILKMPEMPKIPGMTGADDEGKESADSKPAS